MTNLPAESPGGWGAKCSGNLFFFGSTKRNVPSPSPDPGHGATFLKILSRVQSKQQGMAWVLDSWLRNQQGDWKKKKKKSRVCPPPSSHKERQVTSRRGGTIGRRAGGDSYPWTPLSLGVFTRRWQPV
ncbi:unnamed protein product [Rangifer tarandus platyrhynchus]|uniref:Uncharacterized protein n=2 Tax=Rangifer tarandus platyrhynchus TaxID=3082113 RepID=A0ABN8YR41_RANTA|nr:unnamed protein product [Rangifer tarandus platyrhynchus]